MDKMIKIKAVSGSEVVYKNFYCDKPITKKAFVKECKETFCGFDSTRVVKSEGWE
jgi:hypothetical protein